MKKKRDPYLGSSFESFLQEEGILEELKAQLMKEIIAKRFHDKMEVQVKRKLSAPKIKTRGFKFSRDEANAG